MPPATNLRAIGLVISTVAGVITGGEMEVMRSQPVSSKAQQNNNFSLTILIDKVIADKEYTVRTMIFQINR
jgi:hypothetical protein